MIIRRVELSRKKIGNAWIRFMNKASIGFLNLKILRS